MEEEAPLAVEIGRLQHATHSAAAGDPLPSPRTQPPLRLGSAAAVRLALCAGVRLAEAGEGQGKAAEKPGESHRVVPVTVITGKGEGPRDDLGTSRETGAGGGKAETSNAGGEL